MEGAPDGEPGLQAGLEAMANWIGSTLRLMLTDDRFSLTLSGGRHSAAQALNEVLWEDRYLRAEQPGQVGDRGHPSRPCFEVRRVMCRDR
ncbi:hypothetical protein GCM10029978_063990 [Actinoallomurus acanthiterrae]